MYIDRSRGTVTTITTIYKSFFIEVAGIGLAELGRNNLVYSPKTPVFGLVEFYG